ncbi:hypothetical protein CPBF367_35920 [Xanthomonas arboricola pv. juglandis]|nr:hypothetical protein CPBF367_35920 [Xanthomonas arboricola pv. juglandis]
MALRSLLSVSLLASVACGRQAAAASTAAASQALAGVSTTRLGRCLRPATASSPSTDPPMPASTVHAGHAWQAQVH